MNAYNMKFSIKQLYVKTNFNWLMDEKHSINYGANALYYNLTPGVLTPVGPESLLIPKRLNDENAAEIDSS